MKNKNYKNKSTNFYYIYGRHTVISALNNPERRINNVFCNEKIFSVYENILRKFSYEIVTDKKIDSIIGKESLHQGIIANVETIFSTNINDIDVTDNHCKVAVLDQINDPQNIGAIIRSAAAFNVNTIILPQDHSPEESGAMAKAAVGALELVKVIKVVNIKNTLDFLKKNGFWIIGLDINGDNISQTNLFKNKIAIILGAEGSGLRKLTKENCDYLIKIPTNPNIESLNVSNAACIMFYLANSQI